MGATAVRPAAAAEAFGRADNILANVAADMMQRCGMHVDLQTADRGSAIQCRASKAPPDRGGWSVFITTVTGLDMSNPASNPALRGNGAPV